MFVPTSFLSTVLSPSILETRFYSPLLFQCIRRSISCLLMKQEGGTSVLIDGIKVCQMIMTVDGPCHLRNITDFTWSSMEIKHFFRNVGFLRKAIENLLHTLWSGGIRLYRRYCQRSLSSEFRKALPKITFPKLYKLNTKIISAVVNAILSTTNRNLQSKGTTNCYVLSKSIESVVRKWVFCFKS